MLFRIRVINFVSNNFPKINLKDTKTVTMMMEEDFHYSFFFAQTKLLEEANLHLILLNDSHYKYRRCMYVSIFDKLWHEHSERALGTGIDESNVWSMESMFGPHRFYIVFSIIFVYKQRSTKF
jgi:hypothetical protein